MPLGSQINVDPATSGTPQPVAAEMINGKPYQGILVCDAAGNLQGSAANPLVATLGAGTQNVGNFYGGDQTNVSGQITAAQPNPGTAVAGGTVGGTTVLDKANNVGVTFSGGGGAAGSVVIFEASDDSGVTWFQVPMQDEMTNSAVLSYTVTAGATRAFTCSLGGMNRFRVRCTAFVASSTPLVRIDPGTLAYEPIVSAVSSKPPTQVLATFRALQVAAVTTEALVSLTPNRGGTDGAAAAAHSPSAGRTFRVQGVSLQVRNTTTAAVVPVEVYLRAVPSGTVTAASPPLATTGTANPAATLNTMGFASLPLDVDIPPGWSFGLSHVSRNTVNATNNYVLWGYEF